MVAEVQLGKDVGIIRLHPRNSVLSEDSLTRGHDVQVQTADMFSQNVDRARHDRDSVALVPLQEEGGLEKLAHFAVGIFPRSAPDLMKLVTCESLGRELAAVGAVVEFAQLRYEVPKDFIDVHCHHGLRTATVVTVFDGHNDGVGGMGW